MLSNKHYLLVIAISYTNLFWSWDVRHTVIQPETIACIIEIVGRRVRARASRRKCQRKQVAFIRAVLSQTLWKRSSQDWLTYSEDDVALLWSARKRTI
jgi:hypothetical protein